MTEALSAKEPNAEPQNVAKALEIAVSEGFARLSQTMETAFAAYSSLVHVAVGALERKSGDATTPGMNKGDAGAEAPSRPRDASPLRA
jgi:hypothetical protein